MVPYLPGLGVSHGKPIGLTSSAKTPAATAATAMNDENCMIDYRARVYYLKTVLSRAHLYLLPSSVTN